MSHALPPLEITLHAQPPDQDLLSLLNGLLSFNRPLEPEGRYTKFAVFVRDAKDHLCGGLSGAFYFNALFIEHIHVAEDVRGKGIGRALVACAEREALALGRNIVHLETMSFQAPGFFAACGYREYARLSGYPQGAERVHFCRNLAEEVRAAPLKDESLVRLGLRIEPTTEPAEADLRTVQDDVVSFTAQAYQPGAPRPLSVFVRGPGGQVFGGLSASTYWNACFVDLFWLDFALRRQGMGTRLMLLAEHEARAARL